MTVHHQVAVAEPRIEERYLIEEYHQLMTAYNSSHERRYSLLQLYFTIIAVPFSVLAALSNITTGITGSIITQLTPFFFGALVIIGIAIYSSLISVRITQVGYAKAMNAIRGYFFAKSTDDEFKKAVILPTDTSQPKYYVLGSHFYDNFLIALLNSAVLAFLAWQVTGYLPLAAVVFALSIVLHWLHYYTQLSRRDNAWQSRQHLHF